MAQAFQQNAFENTAFEASAGGGAVTVNLTGNSATFSGGSVSVSYGFVVSVTGNVATFSGGTVTVAYGVTTSLTGNSSTFSPGTITVASGTSVLLSGNQSVFSGGSVSISYGTSVLASGNQANFSGGTVTAGSAGDVSVSLTGAIIFFTPGRVTVDGAVDVVIPFSGGSGGMAFPKSKQAEKPREAPKAVDVAVALKGASVATKSGVFSPLIGQAPVYRRKFAGTGNVIAFKPGRVKVDIGYEMQYNDDDMFDIIRLLEAM